MEGNPRGAVGASRPPRGAGGGLANFRLRPVAAATIRDMPTVVSPVFAGRGAELRLLAESYERTAGGDARTVLIGAEAGGGKSRLIREFAGRLGDRALVLTGRCAEQSEASLPYAPFTAMLRELVRHGIDVS